MQRNAIQHAGPGALENLVRQLMPGVAEGEIGDAQVAQLVQMLELMGEGDGPRQYDVPVPPLAEGWADAIHSAHIAMSAPSQFVMLSNLNSIQFPHMQWWTGQFAVRNSSLCGHQAVSSAELSRSHACRSRNVIPLTSSNIHFLLVSSDESIAVRCDQGSRLAQRQAPFRLRSRTVLLLSCSFLCA